MANAVSAMYSFRANSSAIPNRTCPVRHTTKPHKWDQQTKIQVEAS